MRSCIRGKFRAAEGIIIILFSIILLYLLISLYFINHFFLGTTINGVKLSFKSFRAAERLLTKHFQEYKLTMTGRNGVTEIITGRQIGLLLNKNEDIGEIFRLQNQLLWPVMLFKRSDYNIKDLLLFDEALLRERIDHLDCLNKAVIEPRDVSFVYKNGAYIMQKEIAGNKLNKERVNELINKSIQAGIAELDLEKEDCYYKPRFTHKDKKALDCLNTLNKYASAWIKYKFENRYELVDGNVISRWLIVDDRLDVSINRKAVRDYIKWLVNKYDTVGISRSFKSSTGRTLEVTGGLYGWKIDQEAEIKALIKNIEQADKIIKEPVYEQKAVSRGEDDIGNSYIEINITRQYLWFYKDGRCIAQGAVVTGNPNKGNATVTGTYFIVYKERDSVLTGPGYEAKVSYWMPFFGNMGLHDARWRSAFGGEIYKRNGTHGCVNAPVGLAKKIFENIEEGIPVIIYEEKNRAAVRAPLNLISGYEKHSRIV